MKKKMFAILLGIVLSMQGICSSVFSVNSEDDSIVQVEIDMDSDTVEIELSEGEQVQLIIPAVTDMPEINYVTFYSSENRTVVSQDFKLTGCCAGVDDLSIYIEYKGIAYEDHIRITVNVLPNENISAENRAELDRLNGFKLTDYRRRKMELLGVMDEDAPRLTMDKIQELIDSSDDYFDIIKKVNNYVEYPDDVSGSGNISYTYWFDPKGSESISIGYDTHYIAYTKNADNGTVIGVQMLYPEKSEFYENGKDKNFSYMEYNQIKPEGYATVKLSVMDEWSNYIFEDIKDFRIVAYPDDENLTASPKVIENWNPSENNPHTITGLSRDMIYEVQYTGDKTGEYWYEINNGNVRFDIPHNKDEFNIIIPVKKHYKGEPVRLLYGDINSDGKFNIADVVLFQQWLMGTPDIEIENWTYADFCKDGELNVFDLCLMKKSLVKSLAY